jgi:predicted nucleic acid-binding protein
MTETVFVDTSALYAVLDRDDDRHADGARGWNDLLDRMAAGTVDARTHGGVVIEVSALVQRRLGIDALRVLHHDVLPVLEVTWVDAELHRRAVSALLAAARREISLVDWTSFELMRDEGITLAFAFDDDFSQQGFTMWS